MNFYKYAVPNNTTCFFGLVWLLCEQTILVMWPFLSNHQHDGQDLLCSPRLSYASVLLPHPKLGIYYLSSSLLQQKGERGSGDGVMVLLAAPTWHCLSCGNAAPFAQQPQSWADLTDIWRCFSWKGESNSVSHLFPALLKVADLWFSPSSCLVLSFSWAIKSLSSMIQVGHRGPNSIHTCSTTNLQCFHWNFIKIILCFCQQEQRWLHSTGTSAKTISSSSTTTVY